MRIHEVVKKTGLQKRTIYYYIDEKMIQPGTDSHSGYHDFSDEDVMKLCIIRKFRDAGLSLADIRILLSHPRTAAFYLHKQLNQLQTQLLITEETLKNLDRFAGRLPICQSLSQLWEYLEDTEFKPDLSRYQIHYESRDARLIAQYLWQSYIELPMSEYQQFLWQKIMEYTREHTSTDLRVMSAYLQYLPPEELDAASVNQYLRTQKIIALTEADFPSFIEEMKQSLTLFASDPVQKEQWELLYEPVILPATLFAFSANRWLLEFHPSYRQYYENIHACCMMLGDYLYSSEGAEFRRVLEAAFGRSCDFTASSYGELEIAASFHQSVYALLTPLEIKKFLASVL